MLAIKKKLYSCKTNLRYDLPTFRLTFMILCYFTFFVYFEIILSYYHLLVCKVYSLTFITHFTFVVKIAELYTFFSIMTPPHLNSNLVCHRKRLSTFFSS